MRGSVQGILWGALVGAVGVSVLSVVADRVGFRPEVAALNDPALAVVELSPDAPAVMQVFAAAIAAPDPGLAPRDPARLSPPLISPVPPRLVPASYDSGQNVLNLTLPQAPTPVAEGAATTDAPQQPAVAHVAQDQTAVATPVAQDPAPQVSATPGPLPQISASVAQEAQLDSAAAADPVPPAVRINRPGAEAEQAALGEPAQEVAEDAPPAEDVPALLRYRAPFENPQDLPVMGIVLRDIGLGDVPMSEIAQLGFAPTIVINALSPNAPRRMSLYRAAGAEVAVELTLPQGARPEDVEVSFEAALRMMPEVALLYSAGGDVVQSNRQVTAQVLQVLAANGLGFIVEQRGLGNAVRLAGESQVAAVAVQRDLDQAGGNAGSVTRALDQTAFRARQSGDAVILASLNAQNLSVLAEWARDNIDSGVIMGPASGIMVSPVAQ